MIAIHSHPHIIERGATFSFQRNPYLTFVADAQKIAGSAAWHTSNIEGLLNWGVRWETAHAFHFGRQHSLHSHRAFRF
jgi:hypothetical protein